MYFGLLLRTATLTAVHTAYKMFDSEEQMEYCKGVVDEARANLEERVRLVGKEEVEHEREAGGKGR